MVLWRAGYGNNNFKITTNTNNDKGVNAPFFYVLTFLNRNKKALF